ncbi:hypothetical protein TNCV_4665491 [Trichonephila clavipes]|nr:hypothetical protein TNCV_4665491 [Trichonephila clavipes]
MRGSEVRKTRINGSHRYPSARKYSSLTSPQQYLSSGTTKDLPCRRGSELTDVSIVKKLPNVEVLSLSVNAISSLEDFSHCNNLQELYIRKNNISELGEIRHLRDLPKLKNLWLADNPCAESDEYRLTVIRALPQLQKLDNMLQCTSYGGAKVSNTGALSKGMFFNNESFILSGNLMVKPGCRDSVVNTLKLTA